MAVSENSTVTVVFVRCPYCFHHKAFKKKGLCECCRCKRWFKPNNKKLFSRTLLKEISSREERIGELEERQIVKELI